MLTIAQALREALGNSTKPHYEMVGAAMKKIRKEAK